MIEHAPGCGGPSFCPTCGHRAIAAAAAAYRPTVNQHTPGPWRGARDEDKYDEPFGHVYAADGRQVAVATYITGLTTVRDNARLIAAAPDLLALAAQVATFWNDPLAFGDEATVTRLAGQFAPLAYAARNAIAKAEGREL